VGIIVSGGNETVECCSSSAFGVENGNEQPKKMHDIPLCFFPGTDNVSDGF
jgi:hypothetical protein